MSAIHFSKTVFEEKVIKAKGLVLIDFYAVWCGPCKLAGPVIDELAEDYKDKVVIGKIDVDEIPQIAEKYGVMSVPTVIILKDGKEVERQVEFPGKEVYVQMLEKHLKK